MEYKLVNSAYDETFERLINSALAEGFELYCKLRIIPQGGRIYFIQAMIKLDKEEKLGITNTLI